jgi:hypothetical protein
VSSTERVSDREGLILAVETPGWQSPAPTLLSPVWLDLRHDLQTVDSNLTTRRLHLR